MENFFCSPWAWLLFGPLSFILGWFLKDWIGRGQREEYANLLAQKDTELLNNTTSLRSTVTQKEEHINRMSAEISSLQSRIKGLTSENTALIEKANQVEPAPVIPLYTESATKEEESPLTFEPSHYHSRIYRLKKKLKRRNKRINKLEIQLAKLENQLRKKSSPVIKEVPVTIKKEVEVREEVDMKKFMKMLSNVPMKKSKKVIDTSTKKGKPKIIRKK